MSMLLFWAQHAQHLGQGHEAACCRLHVELPHGQGTVKSRSADAIRRVQLQPP